MDITVSKTKRWASSEVFQEADKAAAVPTKQRKTVLGTPERCFSEQRVQAASTASNEHHNRSAGKGAAMSQNQRSW